MKPLRHALRRLLRVPAFSAVVVATLALGIGASTAIFGVVNGVLIKSLPYPHAQQLVGLWHVAPGVPEIGDNINCSPSMYFTYREESRTFQAVGLWSRSNSSVTGAGDPEQVPALQVTYGTLQALEVPPALGRWFSQADDAPGSPETAILSYGYWQRRFGGDRSVIGRAITVDSRPRTVIGVMAPRFRLQDWNADLILPLQFDRSKIHLGSFNYQGLARLKPGVTLAQANADVARMLGIWLNAWPAPEGFSRALFEGAHFGPKIQPLKQELVGDIGGVLWILMGTIGIVLLIACANVANLLLVRADARQQELAIRAALGAGWMRIAREVMLESLTLGLLGGVLGVGLAYTALRVLVAKGPDTLPRLGEIGIDPLVLGFALAISLAAGLFAGLIPVLKYAGPRAAAALRGVGRTFSEARERHRARAVLVLVQVALALILVVASGLMIRTFQALRRVQPGFTRPEEVQMLHITIPEAQVPEPERVTRIENQMLEKLAAIPGARSAAWASDGPMEGMGDGDVIYVEDHSYGPGEVPPIRRFRSVAPGFFATTGTSIVAGRDFTWDDLYQKRRFVIVSRNLAREMWGGAQAALRRRIRFNAQEPWREIIGVAGDVYDNGVQQQPPAFVYWPALLVNTLGAADATRSVAFLVRTPRAGTQSFLTEARQAIWSVNGNVPVFLVRTLDDVYRQSMARTSFTLVMLAIAGGMALLLGIVGIYGVISYAVSQRTREIGIRMALGAQPGELRRMFLRNAFLLSAGGAGIGLAAAAGLTRLMSSLLFGVAALDPVTYVAAALLLLAAAALAGYIPARRATRVVPVEALRAE